MRDVVAAVVALFGAVAGFFIVGFLGCLVAIRAESPPLAFLAVALAIAAAIGGGYLGARLVLGAGSPGKKNRDVVYWADRKDE
jgi:hypothetical protein